MNGFRRLFLWLTAGLLGVYVACSGTGEVSIRELERSPSDYVGRVVTLRGCYHNGPERTLLQPCSGARPEEVVWVVSRDQMEETANHIPGYSTGLMKPERPSAKEVQLNQQLSRLPDGIFVEVLLRGEFRSSVHPEFGTSPRYRYVFILHRVLSVSPRSSLR
jgi:hypothetical protein